MVIVFAMLVVMAAAAPPADMTMPCAKEIRAAASAFRLADLPPEIREDLARMSNNEMADAGSPILQTDALTKADANLPTGRFVQALLVKDMPRVKNVWFVSYEVSMMTPRTVGYSRDQWGRYRRVQMYNFGGPPCESIKAALKGVTSAGFLP